MFAPLVLLTIFFGFYPAPLLDVTAVSVQKLVSGYETAIKAASARPPVRRGANLPSDRHYASTRERAAA